MDNVKKQLDEDFLHAPELIPGGEWFNSPPLTLRQLQGNVVLLDFLSYSCINCVRTFPYLKSWYEKYHALGFEIIGVHTPEFEFEKDPDNVRKAIAMYELPFPIVQDNEYNTWNTYSNHYWPAKYFIDTRGRIRWTHYGEGSYDESEAVIQELLKERSADVSAIPISNPPYTLTMQTPELYLGYQRLAFLASPEEVIVNEPRWFSSPEVIPANHFTFEGMWKVSGESASPEPGAELMLNFYARDVFMVAQPLHSQATVRVLLDSEAVPATLAGKDVSNSQMKIRENRLYQVLRLPEPGRHLLTLQFLSESLSLYTFTFG